MRRPAVAVVEDNPDNQLLVEAILGGDYTLDCYWDGSEALDGLRSNIPDAVLLDISLPGLDGLEGAMYRVKAPGLCCPGCKLRADTAAALKPHHV